MPPIPIYSSSPINASKQSGVTPKTAESQGNASNGQVSGGPTPTTKQQAYAPAQPGATPFLPVQTATAQASSPPQPTRTQQHPDAGPPPPQPGAVPTAAGSLPPPPKAGETFHPPEQTPAPQTMPMPPQMAMPPPSSAYAPYQGTTATTTQPVAPRPVMLNAASGSGDLSHPPGYQQNTGADQFTSQQRYQASMAEGRTYDGEDEGVWDQAKKWATGVGDSLAQAENEVWKRINKQ